MEQRHIPNDFPSPLTLSADPERLLLASLQRILNSSPPQSTYTKPQLGGLFSGHTGIAYLFLHISSSLPKLRIHGYPAMHWAQAYISGDRGLPILEPGNCGLASERLCHPAVRACITKELNDVREFLGPLPHILALPKRTRAAPSSASPSAAASPMSNPASSRSNDEAEYEETEEDPFPTDLIYGRAGALYLLRMVRHWVPNSSPLVQRFIVHLTDRILSTDNDGNGNWTWHNSRYLGAAHGDIGIITQLVMTEPPTASRLLKKLERLLDMQMEDGNWPASEQPPDPTYHERPRRKELVQWCHGAPGFVLALLSLRPFFPTLHGRIDAAIEKARAVTWQHGILRKEPSLCHGILGNSLIFRPGPQREHFLALATPERVSEARRAHPEIFKPAAYGKECALLMNYDPSAAWTWMVCQRATPRFVLFNEI